MSTATRTATGAASDRSDRRADLILFALLAAAAYALKRHYSSASAAQLDWILGPTTALLELGTGSPWPREAGLGYISVQHATAVVTGCAGVNFLIIAVTTLIVGFSSRFHGLRAKLAFVTIAVPTAFAFTVCTNALRILADIALRQQALAVHSHEQAHRLLGVALYLGGACLLYAVADRLTTPASIDRSQWRGFTIPAGCYVFFSLTVPLLNGALIQTAFWTHAAAVMAAVAAWGISFGLVRSIRYRALAYPPQDCAGNRAPVHAPTRRPAA